MQKVMDTYYLASHQDILEADLQLLSDRKIGTQE